jgi:hypothetical protein
MIYIYLKDIFLILIPFLLSNLIFQYFYQTNIIKVSVWWFKYHNEIDYQGIVFIGLFFSYLIVWISTASIFNKVSWALHGEKHEMVYVGNKSKGKALFYPADNLQSYPVEDSNFSTAAFSFKHIYHKVTYLRDEGSKRLGVPFADGKFSWRSLISTICFMVAFTPVFFALMHSFAHVVEMKLETLDFYPNVSWQEAWTDKYSHYGITLKGMLVSSSILIFAPMILFTLFPNKEARSSYFGEPAISLPIEVNPSYTLNALPIEGYRIIHKGVAGGKDTDTGLRVIIFEFKQGFTLPVYIAYKYDATQFPELENLADNNIKHGVLMKVKVLDDLSLDLVR